MTRVGVGLAFAAGVVLLLAGCARPAGVDGDLVDDWSAMPAAAAPMPPDHGCLPQPPGRFDPRNVPRPPTPVDCSAEHLLEVVHLGTFTGAAAARATPPPVGDPARRNAFAECVKAASTFLGGDWRTTTLELTFVVPVEPHWTAGARWFRCDLYEYSARDGAWVQRTASLRGALTRADPVARGCYLASQAKDGTLEMARADCTARHNSEFAGIYVAPDGPYDDNEQRRDDRAFDHCRSIVAAYAGIPNDRSLDTRVSEIITEFSKDQWQLGNRAVLCHLYLPHQFTYRSLHGAGLGAIPGS